MAVLLADLRVTQDTTGYRTGSARKAKAPVFCRNDGHGGFETRPYSSRVRTVADTRMADAPDGEAVVSRIITLTTDFGYQDPFVGIMKGVVSSINPAATIVDLTHGVAPQDVTGGALALAAAVDFFPAGAIHVAVVDPGVGGNRRPILLETDRACYVGPDNGLMSLAAHRQRLIRTIHLSNPEYHLRPTSTTFHGRDIFAPVAAHLSAGVPLEKLGRAVEAFEALTIPVPEMQGEDRIAGEVIYIDGFGNLTTNIRREDLGPFSADGVSVRIGAAVIRGLSANYASAGPGNYLALINSRGLLEISRCNGNAQAGVGARVGTPVLLGNPLPDM